MYSLNGTTFDQSYVNMSADLFGAVEMKRLLEKSVHDQAKYKFRIYRRDNAKRFSDYLTGKYATEVESVQIWNLFNLLVVHKFQFMLVIHFYKDDPFLDNDISVRGINYQDAITVMNSKPQATEKVVSAPQVRWSED